jgi:hypothetical protein
MRIAAFATALAAGLVVAPVVAPVAAFAENGPDTMTCAHFAALPVDEQVAVLSTIEPLGDEMNRTDPGTSRAWAVAVGSACRDHPDRLVPEAARAALAD